MNTYLTAPNQSSAKNKRVSKQINLNLLVSLNNLIQVIEIAKFNAFYPRDA